MKVTARIDEGWATENLQVTVVIKANVAQLRELKDKEMGPGSPLSRLGLQLHHAIGDAIDRLEKQVEQVVEWGSDDG